MDALKLLQEDHDKVRKLFKSFDASSSEDKQVETFEKIKKEVETHSHIEETIFYPAIQELGDDELSGLVDESLEEHAAVAELLEKIDGDKEDGEALKSGVKELEEKIEHHAGEEESEMFPKIRKAMDQKELDSLGKDLQEEKKSYGMAA